MICEVCHKNPAEQLHHRFSQTKLNKRLYGDLIHHRLNLCNICENCHMTKPIPKLSELEFCQALKIQPRSKVETFKKGGDKRGM